MQTLHIYTKVHMCVCACVRAHAIVVVPSLSRVWLFVTPWTAAHQVSLSFTISWSLLRLTSIELMMAMNHHILCHPLLLPPIVPSIRVFPNELVFHIRCLHMYTHSWASLVAQTVKNLPTVWEMRIWSRGQEEMAPNSVFLPGEFHGQRRYGVPKSWTQLID